VNQIMQARRFGPKMAKLWKQDLAELLRQAPRR
jgi:hypothetical protein